MPARRCPHPAGPAGGQLGYQAGVQLAHYVIGLDHGQGGGVFPLVPAVGSLAPHLTSQLAHPFDQATAPWRHFRGETVASPAGDRAFQVMGAL